MLELTLDIINTLISTSVNLDNTTSANHLKCLISENIIQYNVKKTSSEVQLTYNLHFVSCDDLSYMKF